MHHTHFLTLATISVTGTIFTACGPSTQTQDVAHAQVQNIVLTSSKEQRDAVNIAQTASMTQEWETLKSTYEKTFSKNESCIAETKARMKRITTLEHTNRKLKERIETYQQGQVDWELFKRAFIHDMHALEEEVNELAMHSKK